MLRLLLTNDDGISAPGLQALAQRLAQRAEVTVVAPDTPRSACSHSITLHKPLRLYPVDPPGLSPQPRLRFFECSGTPADCVTLGLLHLLKAQPPNLVVSGINAGPNFAEDPIYSGTVAGAVEAQILGVPGLAVSLMRYDNADWDAAAALTELLVSALAYGGYMPWQAEVATQLASGEAAAWTLRAAEAPETTEGLWDEPRLEASSATPMGGGTAVCPCFNVNIPTSDVAKLKGICWTQLGTRRYENVVVEVADPRGKPYYWFWGDRVIPPQPPDSDITATSEGYISVTPIRGDLMDTQDWPHYRALLGATAQEQGRSE